jgi:hypothetical protein
MVLIERKGLTLRLTDADSLGMWCQRRSPDSTDVRGWFPSSCAEATDAAGDADGADDVSVLARIRMIYCLRD